MPTYDDIEYDMEVLNDMSIEQLLIQLCCRHDRLTPKRESQLNAQSFALDIATEIEEFLNDLPPALATLQQELKEKLASFQEVIA